MKVICAGRGTGRRKTAVARVFLYKGTGQITINGKSSNDYFNRLTLDMICKQPLIATNKQDSFDVVADVKGGGIAAHSGALRHGIARALLDYDSSLRKSLKQEGFLTRDSRMKESKKYGRKGARRSFQFSKR